ncbi:MAG: WD40 repeat domain-containing protein [Planctomycetota bacterium]|nr:WD40 repeat domain-containing protein [Planctomycetota bacterium]
MPACTRCRPVIFIAVLMAGAAGAGEPAATPWRALKTIAPAHEELVTSVAVSPDGSKALSGSWDKSVKLWDLESGKLLKQLQGHQSLVHAVAFLPGGERALSGGASSAEPSVRGWDLEKAEELFKLNVACAAFAVDREGKSLILGHYGKELHHFDLADRKELRNFDGHADGATCVALAPNGWLAASGGLDANARMWDLREGKQLAAFPFEDEVACVRFTPDGKALLAAVRDGYVRVFRPPAEAKDEREAWQPAGKLNLEAGIRALAVHPSGGWWAASVGHGVQAALVLGSVPQPGDDPVALAKIEELRDPHGPTCLAFTPDGRRLVSGNYDGTLTVYGPGE